MILIMKVLVFLFLEKILARLKKEIKFALMFCYENNLVYPVHISNQAFENCMYLLMISHIMSRLKILTDLYAIRQKIKIKKTLLQDCLRCCCCKRVFVEH